MTNCTDGLDEISQSNCDPCDAESLQAPDKVCKEPVKVLYPQKFKLNFYGSITIEQAWNIPQCNHNVILSSSSFKNIPIGAFLWNTDFGYFQLTHKDENTITLFNPCAPNNADIGTFIPARTEFVLTSSPFAEIETDSAFLANDFIAPPLGKSTVARLTNLNGIAPGMQVSLGEGSYWLTEHSGGGIVTLQENGGGLPPGTVVNFKNAFDQFQIPVKAISSSLVLQKTIISTQPSFSKVVPAVNVIGFIVLKNPYVNKSMAVNYNIIGRFNGLAYNSDVLLPVQYIWNIESQFDDEFPTALVTRKESLFPLNPALPTYSNEIKGSGAILIPASTERIMYVAMNMAWDSLNDDSRIDFTSLELSVSAMGVLI